MSNTIELVKKYLPLLDAKYAKESITSVLDAPADMIRETADANTVLIPKMSISGLGDYSKSDGFPKGSATLEWVSHTFTMDRGAEFQIDRMDNLESLGMAFGRLAGEFINTGVAPELDAYRLSKYASLAGTSGAATPTSSTIVTLIDKAVADMNDAEVPEEGRILFISNESYNLLKKDTTLSRFINVQQTNGTVNRNIEMFDTMQIVKVPATRFWSEYTFNDGEENFGFAKTDSAVKINFMIIHKNAVLQIVKTAKPRVFEPDVNQKADAYLFQYRIYHDTFVPANKTKGIYVHTN